MAIFKADKAVLLAMLEEEYGADPLPEAANLIIAHDIKVDPAGIEAKRDALLSVEGKLPSEMYEGPVKVSFKTHLFCAISYFAAHVLSPLLQAASFVEEVDIESECVNYTLTKAADGATPSVCFYFYHGGRFCKALGCCGSLKVNAKAGELVELEWEFTGRWAATDVADEAFPSLTGKPTVAHPLRFVGASEFTLGGIAMAVANCVIDFGQKVVGRKDPAAVDGIARYWVESFEPKTSIDPQAAALSAYNPFAVAKAKTLGTLTMVVRGIYLERQTSHPHDHLFSITNLQTSWPKPGERDGLQTYALEATARAADPATPYVALFKISNGV